MVYSGGSVDNDDSDGGGGWVVVTAVWRA